MARKRLISPSFFKHYELYQAEVESGLPLRVAFAGLWTVTDRDKRFRWKGDIKTDILPYDPADILKVLDALEHYGFVKSYVVAGRKYGFIPTFHRYQTFHHTERHSSLPPEPPEFTVIDQGSNGESPVTLPSVTGTVAVTGAGAVPSTAKGDKDLDDSTAGGADDGPAVGSSSATASPAAQGASNSTSPGTPPADDAGLGSLWQLLRDCYQLAGKPTAASNDRQKQVYRDLRATLSADGAPLEGKIRVRAVDAAHLNAACARVLERGVEKPDAAVRLVLLDLQKTWQETKAARAKAAIGEEPAPPRTSNQTPSGPMSIRTLIPAPRAKGLDDAERWLAALGDEERTLVTAALDREVNMACPATVNAPSTRAQLRADLLVKTWQHRDEQAGAA